MSKLPLACFFLTLFFVNAAQNDSVNRSTIRKRKIFLAGATAITAGGSLAYLHDAWYRKYNTGRFHFFDDNAEWLQMDKAGHAYTSYQTGRLMMSAFRWAGFSRKEQMFAGGTVGFFYLLAIETLDGFSRGWGFSWGDMAANASGSALAILQESLWGRQIVQMKFSYMPSGVAKYNPALLGETPATRVLKDYNGQVYWLSFNPFQRQRTFFPRWINISIGYGASGMTGGHANTVNTRDENGNVVSFERRRSCFLSLDLDLTQLRCRSRALRGLLSAVNVLKFPFPAVSFSKSGITGHIVR